MKKFFIAVLLTVTVATSGFTTDEKYISKRVMSSFRSQYSGVEKVTWKATSDFVKAIFEINGKQRQAFYYHNGESIGYTHQIKLEELPLKAKRTFAKKYADYTVKDAIKFEGVDETAYYISAEDEKHLVIVKVTEWGVSLYMRGLKKMVENQTSYEYN
jgi:hypothetical protein